jgi:uncharacterized protein
MQFATDASLGKLGRYLRAAGFDTWCQHQSAQEDIGMTTLDPERVILTRTLAVRMRYPTRRLIFIRDNDPRKQICQVVDAMGIEPGHLKPFSRCLACNRMLRPIDKKLLGDRVPAYVWQRQRIFRACDQCQRVYWAGSHHVRMREQLAAIFKTREVSAAGEPGGSLVKAPDNCVLTLSGGR